MSYAEETGLVNLDDEWVVTTAADRADYEDVPEGKYQVTVDKIEIRPATQAGYSPQLSWTLKITAPTHAGRLLFKNERLTSDRLPNIKSDFDVCGVVVEKLSLLPNMLASFLDIPLEVTKKTNVKKLDSGETKTYTNVYINKRLDSVETQPEPRQASTKKRTASKEVEDNLPF